MSVGIVGAGAVGLFLASALSQITKVTVYVHRTEQLKALDQNGLQLVGHPIENSGSIQFKSNRSPWTEDLIILAVKQPSLPELLSAHQNSFRPNQSLLFIQNGMGHLSLLDELNYSNIYIGVVEHGVRKINDYKIDWTGKGRIRCGIFKGTSKGLDAVLSQSELNAEIVEDWLNVLKDKLLVNAVINPLTALYRVTNGHLFEQSHFSSAARSLFEEVAMALEVPEEQKQEKWDYIKKIAKQTAQNRSSMLQDLDHGRFTEIDAILGYIIEISQKNQQRLSFPLIHFLYESIKGLETLKTGQ